jgi:flagellar basal-body rod protein FlgG
MYVSAAAMGRIELRQEVTANNLANAATTGFRRDFLYARDALALAQPAVPGRRSLGDVETRTILDSGPLTQTARREDLAISGEGFFTVQGNGKTYLTRAGSFLRDATGTLVTEDGEALLGEGGPIAVESDRFEVARSGEVIEEGSVVDTIRLTTVDPATPLVKAGGGRFEAPAALGPAPENPTIFQGHLEGSNVNAIREMVSLIEASRSYEANSKSIMAADDALKRAVNEVGRVG